MSDYPTVPFSLGVGYIDDAEVNAVKAEVEAMQTDVADLKTKALPTVTASDAGKFLRVSSAGIWAAETISSAEEASF